MQKKFARKKFTSDIGHSIKNKFTRQCRDISRRLARNINSDQEKITCVLQLTLIIFASINK